MLSLNINETKTVDFEVQLSGINPDQLNGSLRFEINNVEYGFPAEFKSESVLVNIPPLNNIISTELKEGTKIKAKLEVNGNGFYLAPWSGEFIVSNPVKMEATIQENNVPKINVSKINEDKKIKKQPIKKAKLKSKKKSSLDDITEKQIFQFMEYKGTKDKRIQNIIFEQVKNASKSDKPRDLFAGVYKFFKLDDK